ncbi:MAG: PRC-barrel domain-containing protein [Nitrososphaerota archaeon]|nr:PRC-barrel domain-containing protein [Nitrososphaerota archaeon]
MSITRNELAGKKVYNPDASSVGEVTDIGFTLGANTPSLIVRAPDGSTLELPWASVSSAKDIILTKEVIDPAKFRRAEPAAAAQPSVAEEPLPGTKRFCTSCGKPLTWVPEYKRWYCYKEKKYA